MDAKDMTKSQLKEEIDRLETIKKCVDRAYGAFEYIRKVGSEVREAKKILDEAPPLTEGSPEWSAVKELIHSNTADETDNAIRPEPALYGHYSVPRDLRNISLDERLSHIPTDSAIAREFVDSFATIVSDWGSDLCGGSDLLQPNDFETRHYLVGISQLISRKIGDYKRQVDRIVEGEIQDRKSEEEREQWKRCNDLIDLVNAINLPLNGEGANRVYDAFCTGKLRGSIWPETEKRLRETADSQVVYQAVEILREFDPEKALALADKINDDKLREDIYLRDINCPRSLVKLVTAPDTFLAKRINQYEHPVEFDFDAPLVVLVGRNGSGKSSIMKAIAQYPDREPRAGDGWRRKVPVLSFTHHTGCYFDAQRQQVTEQDFRLGEHDPKKDTIIFRPDIKGRFLPSYVDMTGMYTSNVIKRSANRMSAGQAQLHLIENGVDDIGSTGVYTGLQYIQPSVLLLDEIGNQVDPVNAERIADKLNELTERRQIVIASHNPNVVRNLRPDAVLYSMNEVREGKPVKFRKGDLNTPAIEYLMFGEEL